MRKQETVHICTTWTPSESALNHALEQTEQALTQEGFQHASVYVTRRLLNVRGLKLDLMGKEACYGSKPSTDLWISRVAEPFSKRVVSATGVGVGGIYEQV